MVDIVDIPTSLGCKIHKRLHIMGCHWKKKGVSALVQYVPGLQYLYIQYVLMLVSRQKIDQSRAILFDLISILRKIFKKELSWGGLISTGTYLSLLNL